MRERTLSVPLRVLVPLFVLLASSVLAAPARAGSVSEQAASDRVSTVKALSAPADHDPPLGNLAPTPPMGWNSWNKFHCDINEELIRQTADAMVASGMRDAGYEYINIDDCWMAPERDEQGRLQADPERFPSGIKALADYVHARGLKLGIYSSAGTVTCQGLPASIGHEEVDAKTFAKWGVDYLKYDNCGDHHGKSARERYQAMADALAKVDRPIVLAICEWGSNEPWLWAPEVGGHLWRTTGDINDSWESVTSIIDQQVGLEKYSHPNAWNDPDMLEVGNGGMSTTEYKSHMSMWSLLNAPLLAGNDLRTMNETTRSILTDPEVIAVNQDWGGEQGSKRRDDGDTEVWAKPMSDGSAAVVLFNRAETARTISTTPGEIGLPDTARYTVRDLWKDTTRESGGTVRATVPAHGAAMYIVEPARDRVAAPAVTLGVDSSGYAEPGQSATVTTTLYNDGTTPVSGARLRLDPPDGWTARASEDGHIGRLEPESSASVQWTVEPTTQAEAGKVRFDTAASWSWRTESYQAHAAPTLTVVEPLPSGQHHLSDVSWVQASNGWGPIERDTSNGEQDAGDGSPITIAGTTYEKGLGTHAPAAVSYFAGGDCSSVSAVVGVDDEVDQPGSVTFEIWGDGTRLAATDVVTSGQAAVPISADISGVDFLELRVTDGGDGKNYDHADWASAQVTCA